MANGAIDLTLNVNPVGENHVCREFIHPLPRNVFACLDMFHHFESLRPFAQGVCGVASSTEFDVRDTGSPVLFCVLVAERAVKFHNFFVMVMIENDGLIHGGPGKNWEQTEEDPFRFDLKSLVSDDSNKDEAKSDCETQELSFHSISLLVQREIGQ
jgi:hypothetical protein